VSIVFDWARAVWVGRIKSKEANLRSVSSDNLSPELK